MRIIRHSRWPLVLAVLLASAAGCGESLWLKKWDLSHLQDERVGEIESRLSREPVSASKVAP